MKRLEKVDVYLVVGLLLILFIIAASRMLTKEFIVDRCGISNRFTDTILYELNTTVKTDDARDKITAYTTTAMPFSTATNKLVSSFDSFTADIPHTYSNMAYAISYAETITMFKQACVDNGVGFMYIATPVFGSIECCETGKLYTNERYEKISYFVKELNENGVSVIDCAHYLSENGGCEYDHGDGHWFLSSTYKCLPPITELLNQNGFDFISTEYEEEKSMDYIEDFPESRMLIEEKFGYYYPVPIPLWTMQDKVEMDFNGVIAEGMYNEVLFNKQSIDNIDWAYHNFLTLKNESTFRIHNKDTDHNKGKKILVVGDSFSWPIATYLAADTEYVDYRHFYDYSNDELLQYALENEVDMIIFSQVGI